MSLVFLISAFILPDKSGCSELYNKHKSEFLKFTKKIGNNNDPPPTVAELQKKYEKAIAELEASEKSLAQIFGELDIDSSSKLQAMLIIFRREADRVSEESGQDFDIDEELITSASQAIIELSEVRTDENIVLFHKMLNDWYNRHSDVQRAKEALESRKLFIKDRQYLWAYLAFAVIGTTSILMFTFLEIRSGGAITSAVGELVWPTTGEWAENISLPSATGMWDTVTNVWASFTGSISSGVKAAYEMFGGYIAFSEAFNIRRYVYLVTSLQIPRLTVPLMYLSATATVLYFPLLTFYRFINAFTRVIVDYRHEVRGNMILPVNRIDIETAKFKRETRELAAETVSKTAQSVVAVYKHRMLMASIGISLLGKAITSPQSLLTDGNPLDKIMEPTLEKIEDTIRELKAGDKSKIYDIPNMIEDNRNDWEKGNKILIRQRKPGPPPALTYVKKGKKKKKRKKKEEEEGGGISDEQLKDTEEKRKQFLLEWKESRMEDVDKKI